MSQKGSRTDPGGGSSTTTARRRREPASGFRFTADLTRSINQAFSPPTNTVMQAFRDLQRSLVQPLLPKIEAAVRLSPSVIELAALKPAIPQYNLGQSVIELAALKPAIPQYNLGKSLIEVASRKTVLPPYVLPGLTTFIADQALLAQRMMTPWLTEIGATLTDQIVSHWRVPLTHALEGLFREWSWIASFGADLARRVAQAGLFAAMRAKAALLEGRIEAVDDFIMNWLGLRPTKRRRDAVTLVLLEGQWIPADPETDAHLVLTQIRDLAAQEARAAKSIAETRLRGSRVTLLATHDEKLADPATVEGLPIRGGFDNPRLDQVLARLEPVEQRVAYAYGEGGSALTWEDAAILEGLPAAFGETVRRKLKRARDEIGRRAAMAPSSQIRKEAGREVKSMAKNTGYGSRRGAVTRRSQTRTPDGTWVKRNTRDGRFIDRKADSNPFKGYAGRSRFGVPAGGERATSGYSRFLVRHARFSVVVVAGEVLPARSGSETPMPTSTEERPQWVHVRKAIPRPQAVSPSGEPEISARSSPRSS